MATFVPGDVRVSVPATSANLGPGFDSLGLALDHRDRVRARVAHAGLLIEHAEGADLRGKTVVVTVTGHGLKDIDTALSTFTDLVDTVVDADVDSAARAAGLA
jgi:homoserine kinase